MPYEWLPPADPAQAAPHQARLHLWPYRSLPRKGFVLFIAGTCALVAVPMLSVLGSPVLWGILPFFILVIAGVWAAIQRSYRDAEIVEELTLTPDTLSLTRYGPRGKRQDWQANPHWVRLALHPSSGPVPQYLTLIGNGREVELGAFLSEEERIALRDELATRLAATRSAPRG